MNENEKMSVEEQIKTIVDAEARTLTVSCTLDTIAGMQSGTFVVKYPSVIDRIKIGTTRAKYLEGLTNVDVYTDNTAFILAYLQVLIVKAPKWFRLEDIDNIAILEPLYNAIREFVDTFREKAR